MAQKEKLGRHKINLSIWEGFLANLDRETRDVYSQAVRIFSEVNGFKSLEEAAAKGSEENFVNFVKALRDKGNPVNTIRLYSVAVRRFFESVKRP